MRKLFRGLGVCTVLAVTFFVASCGENPTETPVVTETQQSPLFDVQPNDPNETCMGNDANLFPQYVSGFSANTDPNAFNCTANDIKLANAEVAGGGGAIECVGGEVVTVSIQADVEQTSESARTDIGIWIANGQFNPTNAEDGKCNFFFLTPGLLGTVDADGDNCGDMESAGVVEDFPLEDITILCEDPDGDGNVEIASCVSWTQPGGDRFCPVPNDNFRAGTLPANKSKCNCEPFLVPITILAQLTLEKTVVNNNGGTAVDTDWTLEFAGPDSGSGVEGDASITGAEVLAGTYTLSETDGPADYSTDGIWSCTGGGTFTSPDQIELAPGDQVTCTITNTDDPVFLTLTKDVQNDNGGTAVDTDFTLTGTGDQTPTPVVITGVEGAPAITNAEVSVGTYTLSESSLPGYSSDDIWSCTGDGTFTSPNQIELGLGDSASCEITNTDDPPGLTLTKKVINDDGGTAADTDWTLCFTNGSSACGIEGADAVTDAVVTQGTYTLSEKDGPTNYSTDGVWSCTGGTFTSPDQIQVGLGESASCEITNDDNKPHLTLLKDVQNNNGGTAVDTDWTLCFTNGSSACDIEGAAAVTDVAVDGGTYTLSEKDGPANYSTDGVWSCTGGGTFGSPDQITLASGESASCEITNTDDPPDLTLTKFVDNDDGGTAIDTDWTLSFAGPSNGSGVESDAAITGAEVIIGTYTLSESGGPSNYSTTGVWVCTGDGTFSSPNQITLGLGDSASCEITNTDNKPHLTLTKFVDNTAGGTAIDTDWTLSFAGPSNGSGVEGDAAITNAVVNGGTYTLSESTGPAFYSTDGVWVCTGGGTFSSPNQITLISGESASCEITNVAQERCALGDRLTSVTLQVNAVSPSPLLIEWTDDNGNMNRAGYTPVELSPSTVGEVFTITPQSGTFFDSQNLRFRLGGENSNLKVHLSCSDDPAPGDIHSGTANGFSATLEKVEFVTTQF